MFQSMQEANWRYTLSSISFTSNPCLVHTTRNVPNVLPCSPTIWYPYFIHVFMQVRPLYTIEATSSSTSPGLHACSVISPEDVYYSEISVKIQDNKVTSTNMFELAVLVKQ